MLNLETYDFISFSPSLLVKGKSRMKTRLGGFFSLIAGVLITLSLYFFSKDMILSQNPSVSLARYYSKEETFKMTKGSFFLFVGLLQSNGDEIEDPKTIFDIVAFNKIDYSVIDENGEKILKQESVPVPMHPCTPQDLSKYDSFDTVKTQNYFCFDDEASVEIAGAIGNPELSHYLDIFLRKCQPEVAKEQGYECLPKEEIDSEIRQTNLFLGYSSYYFDHESYEKPVRSYLRTFYKGNNADLYRRTSFFFSKMVYVTDEGYILENNRREAFFQFESSETQELTIPNEKKVVKDSFLQLTFTFNQNGLHDKYKRSYKKLQSALGDISGFSKGMLLVLSGINIIFSKCAYMEFLFNDTFISYNSKQMRRFTLNGQSKSESEKQIIDINLGENTEKIGNLGVNKIDASFKLLLKGICRRKASNQVVGLKRFYSSVMDVRNIILLNQKVNLLKNALLDNSEAAVFDRLNFLVDVETGMFEDSWSKGENKLNEFLDKGRVDIRIAERMLEPKVTVKGKNSCKTLSTNKLSL